jgi:3-methylcrotonyl-CoA carboxylase alpha subunit
LATNIRFLDDLAGHKEFAAADVHTGFIDQHYDELFPKRTLPPGRLCQAAVTLALLEQERAYSNAVLTQGQSLCLTLPILLQFCYADPFSPFNFGSGSRFNHKFNRQVVLNNGSEGLHLICDLF